MHPADTGRGRWIGLARGLGAATADFIYGCIAAFGVTPRILQWLNWASGVMIGAFGVAALTIAVRILMRGR